MQSEISRGKVKEQEEEEDEEVEYEEEDEGGEEKMQKGGNGFKIFHNKSLPLFTSSSHRRHTPNNARGRERKR